MDRWSGVSEAYRRSFATLCAGTIGEVLSELPKGNLLDVGCGTGSLLQAALGRGWDAIGVDADSDMASISATVAPGRVVCAALPDLPFADAQFDAVAANFVLNHVADPRASMAGIARLVRPGGVVAATIWPVGGGGWSSLMGPVFAAAQATALPSTVLPAHLDFERTPHGLAGVAGEAGLTVVSAREVGWQWQVMPDDLWAGVRGGVATVGQTYAAQDADTRARVEQEFLARARVQAGEGPFTFTNRAVLVTAKR